MINRPLVLDAFLPYRLSYTANLVSELLADAYKSLFGLTIPEWRLVAHAAEHDGITQHEIVRRTRMDKVTVSRAAIALIGRDLLARAENRADKRSHLLILTDAGRKLFSEIAPKALEVEKDVFGSFDSDTLAEFSRFLRAVDASTQSLMER